MNLTVSPALKDLFGDSFLIGGALNNAQIAGEDPTAIEILKRHFNAISPENALKWDAIHPGPAHFDFTLADRYVALGQSLGAFIVGHVLLWHQQTPAWVFEGEAGEALDRDTLLARMRLHVQAVVGRYKGRIHGWDVVNEALEDDGTWRQSPWYVTLGEEYVAHAFEFACEADPDAQLYYNDYNLWKPAKRDAAARLVTSLRSRGVRVDGMGEQGHWLLDDPPAGVIEAMIARFGNLGLKTVITELDVDPLPRPEWLDGADVSKHVEFKSALDPYVGGLPDALQNRLAERYADVFRVFMKHRGTVGRVTFWGVTDADTWLNDWPVHGRTNHPLLWDRDGQPKPSFAAVVETARRASAAP